MENLGDILKRLATTRNISAGDPPVVVDGDYSENGDSCELCGGRGWFTPDVPVGHPDFGQVITCECQRDRLEEERSARLLRYSNLGSLSRFTFEALDPKGRTNDAGSQKLFEEACRAAVEYAESPEGWLVFVGPNGSGKTHLAAAIAKRCIDNGHVVFFVHVPDLLDHLRATFAPTNEVSYSDLFEQVKNTPLLILDGLGSQATTPWAQEKVQQIFNHRYNAKLPTIVTTTSETADLDPYVRSRLDDRSLSRMLPVRSSEPGPVHHLGRIEPEMVRRMTFETFDVRGNNPSAGQRASLEGAYEFARNYAADPHGWLTLFGETGAGKTHLAVAIAAERIENGQPVFFAFVPDFLDYVRKSGSPDSHFSYDRLFYEVRSAPLLILDDLRIEETTQWTYEKLYQIVVHRHNARLPTVITSTEDFTKAAGPIGSRVRDPYVGELVKIDAPDYRIKDRETSGQRLRDGARRARQRR